MANNLDRDLTILEYIVLGLISIEPQSGYSIVTYFEGGATSWSAGPGSIYPMLKRLEKQTIIEGELEMEYETRPRKVYRLTQLGEDLLDEWLRQVPKMRPYYQEREIAMWRFQFMERRFTVQEVLDWLQNYLDAVRAGDVASRHYHEGTLAAMKELGETSTVRQLVVEAGIMEMNSVRTWLEMAVSRLSAVAQQTGEYEVILADALTQNDS